MLIVNCLSIFYVDVKCSIFFVVFFVVGFFYFYNFVFGNVVCGNDDFVVYGYIIVYKQFNCVFNFYFLRVYFMIYFQIYRCVCIECDWSIVVVFYYCRKKGG